MSFKLIAGAIIICLVIFGGLVMNIVGILTVSKMPKKMKLFNSLIMCRLSFDSWFLVSAPFFFFGLHHKELDCEPCAWLVPYWADPCGHMSLFGTVLMTLAISHERYCAIKNPLLYPLTDDVRKKRLLIYLTLTLLVVISVNIPRFQDFEIIPANLTSGSIKLCLTNQTCNRDYIIFYETLTSHILFGIVPFFLLIFLGFKTHKSFKDHNKRLTINRCPFDEETSNRRKKAEDQMLKVLKILVITFLVCHTPRISLYSFNVGYAIIYGTRYRCIHTNKDTCEYPFDAYGIVNQIDVLMVMVNSSIGTFLYCASNKDFNALALGSVKKCFRMRE